MAFSLILSPVYQLNLDTHEATYKVDSAVTDEIELLNQIEPIIKFLEVVCCITDLGFAGEQR